METKAEKFERILRVRYDRIHSSMGLLQNLANKRQYKSTLERRNEILEDMQGWLFDLAEAWGCLAPSTPQPEPVPQPVAPPPLPANAGPVRNRDKTDIRVALETLTRAHGSNDPGVAALRRVVLGWATTDQQEPAE